MDETMVSSDPLQAFLLDAQCIRRWLQRTLQVTKARVVAALGHGLGADGSVGTLSKAVAELGALDAVATALAAAQGHQPGADTSGTQPDADCLEVQRVLQASGAGAFIARSGIGARPPPNFTSEAEWRGVVGHRRSAATASLLTADACQELGAVHHVSPSVTYPIPTLEQLIQAVFLSGDVHGKAHQAKLRVLFMHLIDGGWCTREEALEHLRFVAFQLICPVRVTAIGKLLNQISDTRQACPFSSTSAFVTNHTGCRGTSPGSKRAHGYFLHSWTPH